MQSFSKSGKWMEREETSAESVGGGQREEKGTEGNVKSTEERKHDGEGTEGQGGAFW